MAKQEEHTPQGLSVGPWSQFKDLARILAVLVFPQPLGPENKYARAILLLTIEERKVTETNS